MSIQQQLSAKRINKDIPIPYYYQIAEILRETIEDAADEAALTGDAADDGGPGAAGPVGHAESEAALPSETELCNLYDVTRGTVRHALELLEREGLVYREKGRGTFMRRRRVQLDVTRLCSSTEDMKARGWTPGTRVLGVAGIAPRAHVQHQLQLNTNASVWEVYRLRTAGGEPISLQWSYLPCERMPDLDRQDLSLSLYYLLKNVYGIVLRTAEQVIRTRAATAEEAALLGVAEGAPLFAIDRTTYDENETPIEHLHSLWRGDRYDLQVRLYAAKPGPA